MSNLQTTSQLQFFILAGHGGKDPGAIANGVQEKDLSFEQQGLITNALRSLGAKVLNEPQRASFQKTIAYVKTHCQPEDVVVDLHFNAATPTASGTEVYYRQRYAPKELTIAQLLSRRIAESLDILDRGGKPESWSQHQRLGILHTGAAHSFLIETCFLTNASDLAIYQARKEEVAEVIAAIVYNHFFTPTIVS